MAKIDITKAELVWPGKYNEDGTLREVPRVSLPFQVIETVNESRATREVRKLPQQTLFDIYDGKEGDTVESGWQNKLIWGDNLLVMGSLLDKFAGKFDLIYIDPPFATGSDFSFMTQIGEDALTVAKESSIIEEKAYRDTWAAGIDSYLSMIAPRIALIRALLSPAGSFFLHCDWRMNSSLRLLVDEVFGADQFRAEVIWKRTSAHSDASTFGQVHDNILFYSRSDGHIWNNPKTDYESWYIERYYRYKDESGRRFMSGDLSASGLSGGGYRYAWKGRAGLWRCPETTMRRLDEEDRIFYTENGVPRFKRFLDEMEGRPVQSLWDDIQSVVSWSDEQTGYATQKPESLMNRILESCSVPGSLVADFFCGSGTLLSSAEKLGRRWIGCDLGRWGIHVTRKRLLEIEHCNPFEVLNLGRYERQYWHGVTFGETRHSPLAEQALYEYLAFILKLYGAQPVAGLVYLHGKKGKAMVHIGAVDAPVTIAEIDSVVDECAKLKQRELHILGWEWEMGLYDLMVEAAKKKNVKLLLLQIPREVMEQQAAAKGDVRFFELAYLEAEISQPAKLTAAVTLKDFVIPNTELIPEEVRSKVKKWSDYIDYWAVDWDFQSDTFMQGWVAYRTRKDRKLPLASDPHTYERKGKYRILVKVIDIFGNDTSQIFDAEVK